MEHLNTSVGTFKSDRPSILSLPNEVIILIMEYLTYHAKMCFSLTCIRFYNLYNSIPVLHNDKIVKINNINFHKFFKLFKPSKKNIKTISNTIFPTIEFKHCKELQFYDKFWIVYGQYVLSLSFLKCNHQGDNFIRSIISHCPNIKHFKIVCNETLKNRENETNLAPKRKGFINIIKTPLNKAKDADITSCHNLQGISSLKCLKSLSLIDTEITDISIFNEFKWSTLKILSLSKNEKITDVGLLRLSRSCPGLVKLNLSGCVCITDKGIKYLCTLTNLRFINVVDTQVTEDGIDYLLNSTFPVKQFNGNAVLPFTT